VYLYDDGTTNTYAHSVLIILIIFN